MDEGVNLFNSDITVQVTDVDAAGWETSFVQHTRNCFRKERNLVTDRDVLLGRGLCSRVVELSLVNVGAATLTTSDAKCLSRYHWEDLLHIQVGNSIILYFRTPSQLLGEVQ